MLRQLPIILLVPLLVLPGLIPGDLPVIFSGQLYQTVSDNEDMDRLCLEAVGDKLLSIIPVYSFLIGTPEIQLQESIPGNRPQTRAPPCSL